MVSSKVNSFIKRGHRILELKYPVMHSFLNGDNSQGHSLAKLALQLRILAHTHRFGSGGFGWSASAWGRLSNTFGRCEYRNDTTHINTYQHISHINKWHWVTSDHDQSRIRHLHVKFPCASLLWFMKGPQFLDEGLISSFPSEMSLKGVQNKGATAWYCELANALKGMIAVANSDRDSTVLNMPAFSVAAYPLSGLVSFHYFSMSYIGCTGCTPWKHGFADSYWIYAMASILM